MMHLGDITKVDGGKIPPVSLVCGGSPCQDLSVAVAGTRAGLDGARSGLFLEQIRIVKEMRHATSGNVRRGADATGSARGHARPRYMLWENVPGALSSNGGRDFQRVLAEAIGIHMQGCPAVPLPAGGWPAAGSIGVAGGFSLAWRVMDARGFGVPQRRRRIALVVDFDGGTAPEILFESEEGEKYPWEVGAEQEASSRSAEGGPGEDCRWWMKGMEAFMDIRPLPDNRLASICIQGNVAWRNAGCHGKGWKPEESYTLNTVDRHVVCLYENHWKDSRFKGPMDWSPTITAFAGTGGGNLPLVLHQRGKNLAVRMDECGTLTATDYKGAQCVCLSGMSCVRELTPLECERLMGFPDGWTDIGDWIDDRGRKRRSVDKLRYEALGNSIALPMWRWILDRIAARCIEDPTMGSLFDGIGGFPLVWEAINGRSTCLWASEINPFCRAVTEFRFNGAKGDDGSNGGTKGVQGLEK